MAKDGECVYRRAEIELAYVSPLGISVQLSSSEVCTNESDTSHLLARVHVSRVHVAAARLGEREWHCLFFPSVWVFCVMY